MKTFYLIDGYNLGFKIPQIAAFIKSGQTDLAVQGIVTRVGSFLSGKKAEARIIFDGVKTSSTTPASAPNLRVEFSRKPKTADDHIRNFIRKKVKLHNWVVVSSDNEIRFTAQDHGATAMRSEEFLELLNSTARTDIPAESRDKYQPRNIDLDYWMKQFQSEDDNEE